MNTTFLPTEPHNPLKKYVLGVAALIMLALLFYVFGSQAVSNLQERLPDPTPAPAFVANAEPQPEKEAEPQCPEGSYFIGEKVEGQPICKLEPTGCPYGDSIPLGPACDKHAPQNQTSQNTVTVEKPVETVHNSDGK